MTSVTERPAQAEPVSARPARSTGLVYTVWILAIAVVGLAAWLIFDQVSEAGTATTSDIEALLDDYANAWNDYDGARFLELVTDDFRFEQSGVATNTAERQAVLLEGGSGIDWAVETVGEPIMHGDGPWYVAQANRITTAISPAEGHEGLSVFIIVEEDGELLLRRHTYFGRT